MRHKRANLAVMLICVGLSGGLTSGVARATGSEPGEDVQANAGPCIAAAAAADNDKIIDVCGALIDNEKAARPDRVKALMARAAAYDRKQMIDRAIADYDTVLKLDPSLADAHNARGELWRRKGDRPKAIMDFGAAVKLAPNHAAAKSNYKSLSLELERIGAMMAVAGKPSFDCRKARRPVEKAICANPTLADLDREIGASTFRAVREAQTPGQARELQREQDQFIARRNAEFGKPGYDLQKAMRERLQWINGVDGY
ncbi:MULTISPECIES: tetratricopeptide repeat protein [Bradyrhizobium]|jgi:tetratricopeptide (TPR) repeat protein|uniref:Tetratricopeptide (TPR) repeat protein n=1 Tax=Bradyrhizobium elkanii TaxID=29448 RepID=A0A8I1Y0Y8_BRAEL|nr:MULTISPECIES: tetratricopeptide repeat protein [Bradyrhizobium]MBP1291325.1 tetratricopeptide (TPR) repeat protein [Bradyrhizobium elkanii]MCP1928363.1 tetratricopeptide (TPR) repeat protein [Bradyrhizobium elkanii]MCS3474241.1 tetratricopeptide (TPR) repeat protein [Bradyrhizobium elkanii]MCS3581024.1 tetratricopeptide (TPR) repeat protein [Bradyrhizobium elkanii]MCS3723900.1 tetratricopeptide (TPR) repeat protein [Bradyrhizobium elkanii]